MPSVHAQDGGIAAFESGLANGSSFRVSASDFSDDDWYRIETYVFGGACDVDYLFDADGDFDSPAASVNIDSFNGAGISEGNATPVIAELTAVDITNTSGGTTDFGVLVRRRGDD